MNIYAIDIFTMVLQSPTSTTEEIDVGRDLRWIPKYIENRPSSSSYKLQRETLSFILRPAAVHHDIYEEFLISAMTMKDQAMLFSNHFRINYYEGTIDGIVISGSRQTCQRHVKEFARGIGLFLEGVSYETHLPRIDYIATKVSSFEEFDRLVLQEPTTRQWFRNSSLRTMLL